ncbi:MAG: enoyl-CoA hydratase-related protein [Dehalococcoidia bacterium]
MPDSDLLIDLDEHGVMLITFNRPEQMNSLSAGLTEGLLGALQRASEDDEVRAVVITGNGRAFCAGAEVTGASDPSSSGGEGTRPSRHARLDHRGASSRTVETFASCDVPIIAAVNGAAVGAGFGIACCADIRIFGESGRIGTIFIKRGVAADYGASYWLPRIVGTANAYEIFYDGGLMAADRALEIGLAQRVVPDDSLLDEALGLARKIAAGPPLAYTYIRRLIQRSTEMNMHDFLELEWTYQTNLLRTSDATEGFRSFIESRDPQFTGQ